MKKIAIMNNVTLKTYGAVLPDSEFQQWVDECVLNNYWGLPERQVTDPETGEVTTLPAEYTITITDITAEYAEKERIAAQVAAGKNAKNCCDEVLSLILGYTLNSTLTEEQIDAMIASFAPIKVLLQDGRAPLAKAAISSIVPDEVIITSQLKSDGLAIFARYNF